MTLSDSVTKPNASLQDIGALWSPMSHLLEPMPLGKPGKSGKSRKVHPMILPDSVTKPKRVCKAMALSADKEPLSGAYSTRKILASLAIQGGVEA